MRIVKIFSASFSLMLLVLFTLAFAQKKAAVLTHQNPFEQKMGKVHLIHPTSLNLTAPNSELISSISKGFREWKEKHQAKKIASMKIPKFLSPEQKENYIRLYQLSDGTLKINWDEENRIPIFISGKNLKPMSITSTSAKLAPNILDNLSTDFLHENRFLLRIQNPRDEFKQVSFNEDDLGMKHLRYQQVYEGIEVWGADVYVHLNRDNSIDCFNGRYMPTPSKLLNVTPTISKEQAIQVTRDHLKIAPDQWDILEVKLMIFHTEDRAPHLAWLVDISDGMLNHWYYFIEAHTGEFLHRITRIYYDGPVTGSGVDLHNQTRTLHLYQIGSTYYMIDASKPMFNSSASTMPNNAVGVVLTLNAQNTDNELYHVTSANANSWTDKATVSASYYAGIIYDYYKNVHSRNSIDGNGMNVPFIVHYKTDYNNAFWNGQAMIFGDGDGTNFSNIVGALDVAAHELTHGVTQHTANLIYELQPGASNESFSDVFGTMVEFYVEGAGGDWLCGEDVFTPSTPGDALRDMEDPASSHVPAGYKQPTKMSEYQDSPNTQDGDWGGVHVNSGIPNRACFMVADSIGRTKTERIYYRALANYLTQNSQFIDARLALCKSAADLYGADGAEEKAIRHAYDVVEVYGDSGSPPPDTLPPVDGEEWVACVDGVDSTLWRVDSASTVTQQLSTTRVFGKPSVTDEGDYILFVDRTYNLRIIESDGQNETPLSTSGVIWSVAISPNREKIAFTSIYVDTTIYVIDLTDTTGASNRQWKINQIAGSEGTTTRMLYADALDWTKDSENILYDATCMTVLQGQDTSYYWSIYRMRASDGAVWQVLTSQPEGVSIGNPVYASNNDYIIAFDFVNAYGDVYVLGANLETGDVGTITYNYSALGFPSFSNDDSKVVCQYYNGSQYTLWIVGLQSDKITGAGDDHIFAYGGKFPVWFAIGHRPADVEEQEENQKLPSAFTLEQNYPNPFNPETRIKYTVGSKQTRSIPTTLKIYNVLGQLVKTLVDEPQELGTHEVIWDGKDEKGNKAASGVYLYQLKTTDFSQTRKMVLIR